MKLVETVSDLRREIARQKQHGKSISLVPTMGNLHEGHLKLIDTAHQHGDFVVCSIFVNPTQFGEGEDFDSYPRTFQADWDKLLARNCDLLFHPNAREMYPDGTDKQALSMVHVPGVSEGLCGGSRPGHFDGVATVVSKLFNMVQADSAIFGEKDFQQLAVIRKFSRDLDFPVTIIGAPIVREENGLAMSSRNGYLSEEQKQQAAFLYKLLCEIRDTIQKGTTDFRTLENEARNRIDKEGFQCDYFEIRNANNLKPAQDADKQLVILLAAFLGKTRLIDNLCFART